MTPLSTTVFDHLHQRLLSRAGLVDPVKPKYKWADLVRSEWSPRFEQLMRNRLLMGAFRYGTLERKRKIGRKWDLLGAIELKMKKYKETGNTEYLVDIANYCLLEFECGYHPTKHFRALDDHHDHCRQKQTLLSTTVISEFKPDAGSGRSTLTQKDAGLLNNASGTVEEDLKNPKPREILPASV